MPQPDDAPRPGSRRAELERLVYGAGANAEERAAAERELAALELTEPTPPSGAAARDASAAQDAPAAPDASGASDASAAPGTAAGAGPAASATATATTATGATDPASRHPWYRSRTLLVAASAAVFALLLGGLAGWQLSRAAMASGGLGSPVAGSGAEAALDRAADFDDRPAIFDAESGIDRDTLRRIGSAESGVTAYGARSTDGRELCLAVMWERMGGGGSTCTNGGRFPPNGLTMDIGTNDPAVENGLITLRATWFADGTVQLGIPLL
ncbi:hypothetical protein ROT00_17885 [Agromyces mediolanus]|uniref:hypothetical protein n=1 Tax=Agromyces mediolanus TaxID=41986 RepID=UPI0038333406